MREPFIASTSHAEILNPRFLKSVVKMISHTTLSNCPNEALIVLLRSALLN